MYKIKVVTTFFVFGSYLWLCESSVLFFFSVSFTFMCFCATINLFQILADMGNFQASKEMNKGASAAAGECAPFLIHLSDPSSVNSQYSTWSFSWNKALNASMTIAWANVGTFSSDATMSSFVHCPCLPPNPLPLWWFKENGPHRQWQI